MSRGLTNPREASPWFGGHTHNIFWHATDRHFPIFPPRRKGEGSENCKALSGLANPPILSSPPSGLRLIGWWHINIFPQRPRTADSPHMPFFKKNENPRNYRISTSHEQGKRNKTAFLKRDICRNEPCIKAESVLVAVWAMAQKATKMEKNSFVKSRVGGACLLSCMLRGGVSL